MGDDMKEGMSGTKRGQVLCIGLLLLVIGTLSFVYWSGKKQVWFCDEIYTYESSNGFEQEWPAVYVDQWMTGADVEAFFAADQDRLALNDITVRLYNDHVPLYFWLFRTVSFLFFKGSGTIWIGLSINLVFYLIVLGLGYGVMVRLTKRPLLSGAAMLLTGVANRLMMEQATVLRMYMMLLLAEALLLLGALWILKEADKGKMAPGVFLYLAAVSVAGFLTHYDYWIFYGVTAALFCLWLLVSAVRKERKRFWASAAFWYAAAWAGNFVVSLFVTIGIFPYCQWNLNKGKGQTALKSIFDFSADKLEQIGWGYKRLAASLFGESVSAAAGLLIIFGCILGGGIILYRKKEHNRLTGMILTVLTAQLYQIAVCFTMPDAWEERYLWGSFTFMMICAVWGGILVLEEIFAKVRNEKRRSVFRRITFSVLAVGILLGEIMVMDGGNGIAYLFHPDKDVALLEEHREKPWIVYGTTVGVYSYYDWIIPEQICFLSQDRTAEDKAAARRLEGDSFVLYIYEDYLPEALAFFEQELGGELDARYLTKSTNLTVYLVERAEGGE